MDDLKFYRISDGRVWDIAKAMFTEEFSETEVIDLRANGFPAGVEYLRETLEFYGFPLGDDLLTDQDRAVGIRKKRDALLAETDYLLMPDYPISIEELELVKSYRQTLRGILEQEGFPRSVEWPEKPEVIA